MKLLSIALKFDEYFSKALDEKKLDQHFIEVSKIEEYIKVEGLIKEKYRNLKKHLPKDQEYLLLEIDDCFTNLLGIQGKYLYSKTRCNIFECLFFKSKNKMNN